MGPAAGGHVALSSAKAAADHPRCGSRLFNDYMQLYPSAFADMRMWHYRKNQRSSDYPPVAVMFELLREGTFVFLGNRQPGDKIDYEIILNDFDRLLPLFKYVESDGKEEALVTDGFHFRAGTTDKSAATTATLAERELNINLKHVMRMSYLYSKLPETGVSPHFGTGGVRPESRARLQCRNAAP